MRKDNWAGRTNPDIAADNNLAKIEAIPTST